jgi:uncharacterized protein YjbJ (UPF0337 family)
MGNPESAEDDAVVGDLKGKAKELVGAIDHDQRLEQEGKDQQRRARMPQPD